MFKSVKQGVINLLLFAVASLFLSFELAQTLEHAPQSKNYPYTTSFTPRWTEIPEYVESDNYLYVTHKATLLDGTEERNFSLCFDKTNYAALWVAYPCHAIYDGDSGRTNKWAYDPLIPTQYQAKLTGSYGAGSHDGASYDRGHQMASNDRQATAAMNQATFYYSNMTPQLGKLNQQRWKALEDNVRKQVCADTLFVVTGADYSSVLGYALDKENKSCPIPAAYYKVLIRTRAGDTGKSIWECEDSELQAIGYWAEHRHYSTAIEPVSVKYIEEKTGFNFFPGISDAVKASYNSSDWF